MLLFFWIWSKLIIKFETLFGTITFQQHIFQFPIISECAFPIVEIYSVVFMVMDYQGPTVPVIIIFIASVAFLMIKIFIVCVKTKKDSLGHRRILDIAY